MPQILSLTSDAAIAASFPVMHSLRPHLQAETYVAQIRELMTHGFELAGLYDADQLQAVAGFVVNANLVSGKKLYVDPEARSRGYGQQLLDYLEQTARARGCKVLHLDSGVQRHGAHKFYLRNDFQILAHHFVKVL